MNIYIDKQLCTLCGECTKHCPQNCICINDNDIDITQSCIQCGLCIKHCVQGAIKKTSTNVSHALKAKDIYIVAQVDNGTLNKITFELASQGRILADKIGSKLCVIVVGNNICNISKELSLYGVDKIICIEDERLSIYNEQAFSIAIFQRLSKEKPLVLLMGATEIGKDLAPRLAAMFKTGLTADCTHLDLDKDKLLLLQTRPAYGGNIMATIITERLPQMATVRKGVIPIKKVSAQSVDIELFRPTIPPIKAQILSYSQANPSNNIFDAQIIVAGGIGMGSAQNFKLLEKFANAIGGKIGASRGAVERGYASAAIQIGQTGHTVSPKLFISCGISGAIQHIAGMKDSNTIIAINTDKNAPIMNIAHYGYVADVQSVLPDLQQEIQNHLKQR